MVMTNGDGVMTGHAVLPGPVSRTRIAGVGTEIPANVVTTAEVEAQAGLERFGLEPGWLEHVTGVRERRWADPEVRPSELAVLAARKALADAGTAAGEIDTLIFAGITRDCLEPATANLVADALGTHNARVFDLLNACNGVMDGIDMADSLIRCGKAGRVLVTTGERVSLAINWQPRTIGEVLRSVAGLVVGDGGGAVVVEASDDPGRGIVAREFHSAPTEWRHAIGGWFRPAPQACEICGGLLDRRFLCDGRALFEAAFGLMGSAMDAVMSRTGWRFDDLDVVFCHQPTKVFIDRALSMREDAAAVTRKLWRTAERYGNTSTCSMPLAMSEAKAAGTLVPGARVLLLAPSSGVSAAALTLVW
jgi:3-oxoacyl-(acyl-carrier-protein) synthase III